MLKLWIILFSTGLINSCCFAQVFKSSSTTINSWEFYHYLKESELNDNAITWLEEYPDSLRTDSINNKIYIELAQLYFLKNQITTANLYVKKIKFFTDSTGLNFAIGISILTMDTLALKEYLKNQPKYMQHSEMLKLKLSLKILSNQQIHQEDIPKDSDLTVLSDIAMEYMHHKPKSPVLAGLLSALLPGLGKYYIGYKYQAISAFSFNAVLGAILAEGMMHGHNLLRWVLPLPVFVMFYAGNIMGTVLLAKKREIDFNNNADEKIKMYYRTKLLYSKRILTKYK